MHAMALETLAVLVSHAIASAPTLLLLGRARQPDTGNHVLGHPLRLKILDLVGRRPGITMSELRKLVGLGWGNGYHHIEKLRRAGLIHTQLLGRRRTVWPTSDTPPVDEARARAYLRNPAPARLCRDVAEHPGTNVAAIVRRTGMMPHTAYYHLRRLRDLGLVKSRSPARQFALYVEPLYVALGRPPGQVDVSLEQNSSEDTDAS